MAGSDDYPIGGACACGQVRYRIVSPPLFVHCCHCRRCQRETGAAFALNALIETDRVEILEGAPEAVLTPTASGKGQSIFRCPACRVALWSHYAGAGEKIAFIRVGTLDNPDLLAPDIHIYTSSRQPWVVIPDGALATPEYYSLRRTWPAESIERFERLRGA